MKILMVNKFLYPNGGSETYIFKLGDYLKSIGHDVEYFGMEHEGRCVSNSAEQYTADMDFHTNSALTKLTYPIKTVYSPEAKRKMGIVLEDFCPDVVHLNNFNYQLTPSIIYAVKKYEKKSGKRVKIIYTAHDYQLICPNHMMQDMNGEICEKCINGAFINCTKGSCIHSSKAKSLVGTAEATLYRLLKTYRYIDCVICPSEFMKNKLDTNPYLSGKTVTLHNFIDNVKYEASEKKDYVLYFGRYSKEKGIENILKATDINFICAGTGEYDNKLNEAEHITNVGFKSGKELETLIREAKCSVYPSIWYENCPFSVMESIMHGTPVIGADIGGIPELIDGGKTGFLFESGNTQDMVNAIKKITDNPALAEEMSKSCIDKKFDTVSEYTEKYLKIVEEC
jgi:glycosyltransferase involved in cell wall biosynthesis